MTLPDTPYKGYEGPVRSLQSLATVQLGDAHWVTLDEDDSANQRISRADYGQVQLLPGPHRLTVGWGTGVSVFIDTSGYMSFVRELKFTAEAGKTYVIHADRTTGHGYRVYFWLVDVNKGKLVAGDPIP